MLKEAFQLWKDLLAGMPAWMWLFAAGVLAAEGLLAVWMNHLLNTNPGDFINVGLVLFILGGGLVLAVVVGLMGAARGE